MSHDSASLFSSSSPIHTQAGNSSSFDQNSQHGGSYQLKDFRHDLPSPLPSSSSSFDHDRESTSALEDGHAHNESDGLMQPATAPDIHKWTSGKSSLWRSIINRLVKWTRGPERPRPYRIQSSEWMQYRLDRLLDLCLPQKRAKVVALLVVYFLWGTAFTILLRKTVQVQSDSAYGTPLRLSCTSRLWPNTTQCGLDGRDCRPFTGDSFSFVCPADCKGTQILEPHYIGSQVVNYRSLVIGGPDPSNNSSPAVYRGDSFICAAAVHAGVIADHTGGCGILSRNGQHNKFPSMKSHGIESIGFFSSFPLSFTFEQSDSIDSCADFRWSLLGISIMVTGLLSTFVTSAPIFFWSIFVGVFFHVALASDPPFYVDYTNVISMAFRRFLPATFVAFVFYKYCVHNVLSDLRAPLERTLLWLFGCWVGSLNNYTFDKIPISRLTPHDLEQQPGAIVALLILIGVILVIAIGQAYCFWREGRMRRYLLFYAIVASLLLVLASVPGMNLRIHHYILALIFVPGTSLQTRPSLLYQGILVGLFINGIARWGFDSVLQTPGQLISDGELGSAIPHVDNTVLANDSITFYFGEPTNHFDGISAMVNDVLRFQAVNEENLTFEWIRHVDNEPEYFRFGYVKTGTLSGAWYGDFSSPGVWSANQTWTPGPV